MLKRNFNDNWFYEEGDGNALDMLFAGGSKGKSPVTLPHDASIRKGRDPHDPTGGAGNGFFVESNCNYTKDFFVTAEDTGKVTWMEFEGVYQNAFVYLNNSFVGKHPYGYGNFYLDITKFLKYGEMNHLQVVVKNGLQSGRWYTGSGIYRDVNIMTGKLIHFIPDGIHLTTLELEESQAVLQVDAVLETLELGVRDLRFVLQMIDKDGYPAAEVSVPVTLQDMGHLDIHQKFVVKDPAAWSPESPVLYRYVAKLCEGEEQLDVEEGTFGIRKLQIDALQGLRINGKTVNLRGGCVHHDNGILGSVDFKGSEERKVKKLKEAGYNAIRGAHNPISRKMLEACDRYGMLVMDELTDAWTSTKVRFDYGFHFLEWWEVDITNMVNKDYNHPSVILYSIGNEIQETKNKLDVIWGKRAADKIRDLDPGRYTVNCINIMQSVMDLVGDYLKKQEEENLLEINTMMTSQGEVIKLLARGELGGLRTEEAFSHVDVAGYNYESDRYRQDGALYPNRIIVGSETSAGDLDKNWPLVEELPYVIGDFSWTAWDYLGEAGIGSVHYGEDNGYLEPYPWKAAYCADFDLTGNRTAVSYWRELIWGLRKRPYLAVCPPEHFTQERKLSGWRMTDAVRSWNWSGFEGKPVRIEIYSAGAEVELLVNGRSVKREKNSLKKKFVTVFETLYAAGVVETISYEEDGTEIGRDWITTADSRVQLNVQPEKTGLKAGGQDICYVEIELQDAQGIINPEEKRLVSISVEGAGTLQGYGCANPESEENYYDQEVKAFEGRLLAVIRSGLEPGQIKVCVRAEGCDTREIKLVCE